jgi:WD40 repeat protein
MAEEETHQTGGGSSGNQIAGDMVGGDKFGGDKVAGNKVEGDKITVVVGSPEQAGAFVASLRWSWPTAWDFRSYREEKRKDFVGRGWLFADVRAWAINPDPHAPRALLILADYGVGKSAFLAELLASEAAGLPVVTHHFCTSELEATLTPELFVRNLATQLANALPAYRQALEAEEAKDIRQWLDEADRDPSRAFDQAILAPLLKVVPPTTAVLWVVDALDEAQDVRAAVRAGPQLTIVQLLARYASRLPRWIKVLATSRRRPDVLTPLRQAFSLQELDAEEARNLDDLYTYTLTRCRRSPLAERLKQAGLSTEETARFLSAQKQSSGKFLYVERVLNDLASGRLPLRSRNDLEQMPPGMDGFYRDVFERRFPSDESYALVRDIFGVLCEQREPLGRLELAAILSGSGRTISELDIRECLKSMHDLMRLVSRTEEINGEQRLIVLHSFDHISLSQWLSEVDEWGYGRADRFMVVRAEAAERLGRWAKAEATNKQAHTWPYLVRHLAAHLKAEERPAVMAGLLGEFTWLEARLRQEGVNALLADCALAAPSPCLGRLERTLRQGAHVLTHSEGWLGYEQFASQLLVRLAEDGGGAGHLRAQAMNWLHKDGGAPPVAASLAGHEALFRTLPACGAVNALVVLPDGRLASGSADSTIRLWDLASGACERVFEGHQAGVRALAVLPDGRLASGSNDRTIRLWDPASGYSSALFKGLQSWVRALAVLPDGHLASGSDEKNIRIWDPASGSCLAVFKGHQGRVRALAVFPDGRLVSGSEDCTVRIWDPASGACLAVFKGHQGMVRALAVFPDGRLVSGSEDCTIRIWDPASGACERVFKGHQGWVRALAVLPDGHLASGSDEKNIRIWDPASGSCLAVFKELARVRSLAVVSDGLIAAGCFDGAIRLWDTATSYNSPATMGHRDQISAIAALPHGHIASGSADRTIRIWDPVGGSCSATFWGSHCGHKGRINSLVVLPDGLLASGSDDSTIILWDPKRGRKSSIFKGHRGRVTALMMLDDGRLASGSQFTISLWVPSKPSRPKYFTCSTVLKGHDGWVRALAMLPDGRLVSGSDDCTVRVWDPASGSCSAVLKGHQGGVVALAVFPDGRYVSGSEDGTIRLWNPASNTCVAVFDGHQGGVRALSVLPDRRLASGSNDSTIRLWDPRQPDGAPRMLFVADNAITAQAWLPTHQMLVAGDASGRLHWLEMAHCLTLCNSTASDPR